MPTCSHCATLALKSPSSTTRIVPPKKYRALHLYKTSCRPTRLRASSTRSNGTLKSSGLSTGSGSEHPASRHEILTLLHKATALLPRALPSRKRADKPDPVQSLEFWSELLAGAYDDLTSTVDRTARIVVYGVDEWSGARDLITALLEDPFNANNTQNEAIRCRWKDRHKNQKSLIIAHSTSVTTDTSIIQIPSSYLEQFPIPIHINELSPPSPTPSSQTQSLSHTPRIVDDADVITVFQADIPIIVCNPLTTPLPLIHTAFPINNTILVVTSTSSPPESKSQCTAEHDKLKILFIDPARAVRALRAFKSDSNSSLAVQRYQDDFVGSRITTLTDALKAKFSFINTPQLPNSDVTTTLRTQTALAQIRGALSACALSLQCAKADINMVCADVSELSGKVEEMRARVQNEILGLSWQHKASTTMQGGNEVAEALKGAEKDIRVVMDRLTWWRMIWRVDEISGIVGAAVERAWCTELEKKLILHTGRLSALQKALTSSTFTVLSSRSSPPFNSPLLYNTVLQLCSSPSYPLTPQTLTSPLHIRRTQIIRYPTTRLHLAGQRAVLGMSCGLVTGVGVSWAGWVGWLAGTGEGVLPFVGMDAGTAIGVGVLSGLAGVRWAVGRWENAKRRWWEDWVRVGEGLGRDLTATLDQTMQGSVLVVAETGCAGLLDLVKKRESEIGEIERDLTIVRETLVKVEDGIGSRSTLR